MRPLTAMKTGDTGNYTHNARMPAARVMHFPNRDFRNIWTLAASVQPAFVLGGYFFMNIRGIS
jgi:hypothetical protein